MLVEVDGFVLSEVPYKESSKIINVLTKEYGIIGILCKGAKSIKSKNRVSTMKLSYSRFNIYYKKDKLSTLVSADIIDTLNTIKSDITLIGFLNYITELTNQVYKESGSDKIYGLFISIVLKMNAGLDPLVLMNILELKYLEFLGVLFSLDACVKCGSTTDIITLDADEGGFICKSCRTTERLVDIKVIKMIRMYYYLNIDGIKDIKIDKDIKVEINNFLSMYYERYTGMYLNSKKFLDMVM